jgi:pimeloyl-ACP methyl ester carboxylesterase
MPFAKNEDHEICFEEFGPPDDPALLLVNGYRSQMVNYEDAFCELLTTHGFRVIRFDNRDTGLTKKTQGSAPTFEFVEGRARLTSKAPYTVSDMAADGMAVLDHLGIDRAHVAGMSMGGMIVQVMAINHPDRVLSMTSIMSTTGDPALRQGATPEALAALGSVPPSDRDGYIEHSVQMRRAISGPLYDPDRERERAARGYDRSFYPQGAAFQMAAVLSDGDRTERLGNITCPALVIHGRVDPLVPLAGGEATAKAIPGAALIVLDEMGHDLPQPLWPEIAAAIAKVAAKAQESKV